MRAAGAVIAFLLALAAAAPAAGAGWVRPVPGEVVAPFAYDPAEPFRPGARRNLRLAARPGALVRAACAGDVTFAGRVPGGGAGVSVRCGGWHVTHLGLRSATAAPSVAAGDPVGVSAGASVAVGVRRAASRWRYVDPERLLPAAPPPAGPARVPSRRPSLRPPPRGPRHSPAPHSGRLPWTGYAGLAAVALAAAPVLRRLSLGRARRTPSRAAVAARSP